MPRLALAADQANNGVLICLDSSLGASCPVEVEYMALYVNINGIFHTCFAFDY